MWNDTYGEITPETWEALCAVAHRCQRCGMLADVDPIMHASRYGHAPAYTDANGLALEWSTQRMTFAARDPEAPCRQCSHLVRQHNEHGCQVDTPDNPWPVCQCARDYGFRQVA